ncbi:hypothetical protein EMPS_01497 [Entomortierella parvispora]|uniref:Uncharacterized protein n=1 Tax=Entomortierella parvispora TaxID=205924 RepID=A0A9P3H309_9FUNG|nr:hypothetical protein EMPS_01497 [Entomortierella parvispora]
MQAVDSVPQFHCATTYDGKVFLLGNALGFAIYDIATGAWSTAPPTFSSSSISMTNLLNQQGISAAVGPDGYTVSILATSPPTYMEINSCTMTMSGVALQGFTPNLHGFCMDVMPTNPPTPIVCGGSTAGLYSSSCWQLGLGATSSKPFATLLQAQDGCTLAAYDTHFTVWPGYLSTYHSVQPVSTAYNPDMTVYDMATASWSTIPNLQGLNYLPLSTYLSSTTMPGTGTTVFFGGQNPVSSNVSRMVYYFDLQSSNWVNAIGQASNPFPTVVSSPSQSFFSSPTSPSGPPSSAPTSAGSSSHSNVGAIAGGAVGGVVVVGALAAFFFYSRRKTHQRLSAQYATESPSDATSASKYNQASDYSKVSVDTSVRSLSPPPRHPQMVGVVPEFGYRSVPQSPQATY